MSHPFDATLKELVRRYPLDWLAGLNFATDLPVSALDVDLSTLSASGDAVLGIGDPLLSVVQIEFQSSRDATLPRRLLMYNGVLHARFAVPVHRTVVLLRPEADDPAMNGTLRYDTQGGRAGIDFRFEVVRVWERPASAMLAGGAGMLPLAPLGELPMENPPEASLERLLRRIDERLAREMPPAEAKRLLMAAWVLIGLRVGRSKLKTLKENLAMVDLRESSAYWLILEEGIARGLANGKAKGKAVGWVEEWIKGWNEGLADGLRAMLVEVGSRRLGTPTEVVQAVLRGIDDAATLFRMGQQICYVANWQELLATR